MPEGSALQIVLRPWAAGTADDNLRFAASHPYGLGATWWEAKCALPKELAAKHAGPRRLHTIYITKEQRTDGTWSALTGKVMFIDPWPGTARPAR